MSSRQIKILAGIGLVLTVPIFMGFAPKDKQYREELRPLMQGLFLSVQEVLPFYLDRPQFQDPENAEQIAKLLDGIQTHASKVEGKTAEYDTELKMYGENFQQDAKGAYQAFQKRAYGQAYYHLEEVLSTCFSCHASRPTESDSKFADLASQLDWEKIGEFYKPRVLIISRLFDQAATEYERLILERGLSMEELLHFDPLLNYLTLTIRVKNNKERALKAVSAALKKSYPRILKKDLEVWQSSLQELILDEKKRKDLITITRAEELIGKGRAKMEYPRDQRGIVYYLEASRVLKELLVASERTQDQANVAYLLGLTELVVGNTLLGLEAQRYFEQAIRLQPKSNLAKRAFDLYEETLIFGYSGSSGLHLPATEKSKLEELRKTAY